MTSTTHTQAGNTSLHWIVALLLGLLLLGLWLMGCGPGGSRCTPGLAKTAGTAPAVPAPTIATAPVAAPAAPAAPAVAVPAAAVTPAPVAALPFAKVYFGLDRTDLPKDVDKILAEVVSYVKANANSKAAVSGFHDPSGNKAHNDDLARNRALAVQGALMKAGIAKDSIVMNKPSETTGSGPANEARRVEVGVVKP